MALPKRELTEDGFERQVGSRRDVFFCSGEMSVFEQKCTFRYVAERYVMRVRRCVSYRAQIACVCFTFPLLPFSLFPCSPLSIRLVSTIQVTLLSQVNSSPYFKKAPREQEQLMQHLPLICLVILTRMITCHLKVANCNLHMFVGFAFVFQLSFINDYSIL